MKSLRIKLAAIAVAVAALVAAPAAANAYTPAAPGGTTTVAPGATVPLAFSGYTPGSTVTFTLSGENGAGATLAVVKAAPSSPAPLAYTVGGDGVARVRVTLPSDATGNYSLYANGVLVQTLAASGQVPAATGVDSASLMGVWIGGGVLLLGGLAVTVFAVRRQRQDA